MAEKCELVESENTDEIKNDDTGKLVIDLSVEENCNKDLKTVTNSITDSKAVTVLVNDSKEDIDLVNNTKSSLNISTEEIQENDKVFNEKFIEPFKLGWSREVVERATVFKGKRMWDVYYRSPDGMKKLRSMPDVINYLKSVPDTGGLTQENFTFYKRHIYREPFEVTRKAKERTSSNKSKSPSQTSYAKSPSTPKRGSAPKNVISRKKSPAKRKLDVNISNLPATPSKENIEINSIENSKEKPKEKKPLEKPKEKKPIEKSKEKKPIEKSNENNQLNSINKLKLARPFTYSKKRNKINSPGAGSPCKKFKNNIIDETEIQLCSERCFGTYGELPSLQCSICLCLFHPSCIGYTEKSATPFTCKRCCDNVKSTLQGKLKNLLKSDNQSSPKTDESLTDDESSANICVLSPEVVLQHEGSDQDDVVVIEKPQTQKFLYGNPPVPISLYNNMNENISKRNDVTSDSSVQNSYFNSRSTFIRQMPPLKPASQLTQQPGLLDKKISVASTFFPPCFQNNSQIRIVTVPSANLRLPLNQQTNAATPTPPPPPLRLSHTNMLRTNKPPNMPPNMTHNMTHNMPHNMPHNRFVIPGTSNSRPTRPLILQKNANQCFVLAPQKNIICATSNSQILGPFPASSLPQLLAIGNKLVCISSANQSIPSGGIPIRSIAPRSHDINQTLLSSAKVNMITTANSKIESTSNVETTSRLSTLLSNPSLNENPYKIRSELFKSRLDTSLLSMNTTSVNESVIKSALTTNEIIDNSIKVSSERITDGKYVSNIPLTCYGNKSVTTANFTSMVCFTPYNSTVSYNTAVTTVAKMETTTTPAITAPMTTSRVSSELLPTHPPPPLPLPPPPPPPPPLPTSSFSQSISLSHSEMTQLKLDIKRCNQNIIKNLLSPSKTINSSKKESAHSESINETTHSQKNKHTELIEINQERHDAMGNHQNNLLYQKTTSCFNGLNAMTSCYNCLNIIFSYLDIIDLLRSRLVCKTWHTLASQPFLWKSICLNKLCIINWKRFAIAVEIHSTKYLDMKGMSCKGKPYDMWRNFVDYLNYFENITYIDLGQVPTFVLYGIAEILLNLKTLKAECIQLGRSDSPHCTINFSLMKKLIKLEFLQLRAVDGFVTQTNSYGLMSLQRFIKLKHLSITTLRNVESEHFKFLEHLKLLEVLEIGDCYDWKIENYLCLGNLTNLRKLRIEKGESTDGLVEALSNLTMLEQLHLICCKTPPMLGSALKKLKKLKFFSIWPDTSSCASVINSNTLHAVSSLKNLQEFHWVILSADGTPEEPSKEEKLENCAECQVDFTSMNPLLPFEDENCKRAKELNTEGKKTSIKHITVNELRNKLHKELPSTTVKFFRVPLMLMDKYCALK